MKTTKMNTNIKMNMEILFPHILSSSINSKCAKWDMIPMQKNTSTMMKKTSKMMKMWSMLMKKVILFHLKSLLSISNSARSKCSSTNNKKLNKLHYNNRNKKQDRRNIQLSNLSAKLLKKNNNIK